MEGDHVRARDTLPCVMLGTPSASNDRGQNEVGSHLPRATEAWDEIASYQRNMSFAVCLAR